MAAPEDQFNIHAAKTHLSRLVERAEAGEEIVIARAGKPVATLSAYRPPPPGRGYGMWKGEVWIAEDFNDPLPDELLKAFYGGELPVLEE